MERERERLCEIGRGRLWNRRRERERGRVWKREKDGGREREGEIERDRQREKQSGKELEGGCVCIQGCVRLTSESRSSEEVSEPAEV